MPILVAAFLPLVAAHTPRTSIDLGLDILGTLTPEDYAAAGVPPPTEGWGLEAIAAVCAEACGVLSRLHTGTLEYTKQRKQFGARVADFQTLRAEKLLMGDGKPSVQYIETFSIPDLDGFVAEDMPGATVQGVMGQFMGFADAPQFIVVSEVQ